MAPAAATASATSPAVAAPTQAVLGRPSTAAAVSPAATAPKYVLDFLDGTVSKFDFKPGKMIRIGRWRSADCDALGQWNSPDCDVAVKSNCFISNTHCKFTLSADGVVTVTDKSMNGTFVNGKLLGKDLSCKISPKDIVSLAKCVQP
mmetsp:Transcript_23456/g.34426  ORF Transcript_23456/g.34426 Transcript_23456/m.34426 type:complete len:147 (+) Transcript_23456:94-534(+)